jgi:restriction endonuclease Mrr
LFQERVVEQTSSKAISWFQFEKDVAALMQRLGFTVEHKAVSRSGDQGVDILATKISPQTESWIIQCKCYSPHRKIGPDTVRELLGTIQLYPQRGSGMIITTSSFTRGAEALAEEHQIRLINGLEFAKLLAS